MEISDAAIQELKAIHLEYSGEHISDDEAREMGQNLFRLFFAVAKPFPKQLLKDQIKDFPKLAPLIDEEKSSM